MSIKPYYGPHAGITIYHGDCLEILPTLQAASVDLVLQDRVAKEALRHPKELGLMQQEQGTGNREEGTE